MINIYDDAAKICDNLTCKLSISSSSSFADVRICCFPLFYIYQYKLKIFGFETVGPTKTAHFKTSPRALGNWNAYFSMLLDTVYTNQ